MSVFFIWLPKKVTFWSISIWQTWSKVFKNRPSEIFKREPLKNLKWFSLIKHTISLQIFESCLPQISLGPFLNTLSRILSPEFLLFCKKWKRGTVPIYISNILCGVVSTTKARWEERMNHLCKYLDWQK